MDSPAGELTVSSQLSASGLSTITDTSVRLSTSRESCHCHLPSAALLKVTGTMAVRERTPISAGLGSWERPSNTSLPGPATCLVKTAAGSSAAEGAASPPAARNRAASKAIKRANRRFCIFSFTPSMGLVDSTIKNTDN